MTLLSTTGISSADAAPARSSAPALPRILSASQHPIRREEIHPNVLFICHRLNEQGHLALVVGGAVRDLLQHRHPKDFDLATTARPEAVRTLFRNARIIGRRFRLAELRFPRMSVEVSTFRGEPSVKHGGIIKRDNTYGTPEEDAFRRDFTVNALSFDPISMTLYDYVGGLRDLEERLIRTIKPPEESFREDPVRMLRAVRFKVRLGFEFDPDCETTIRRRSGRLQGVTRHRLAEETQRFLTRGNAVPMFAEFDRLGLLYPLLDVRSHEWFFDTSAQHPFPEALMPYVKRMDQWVAGGGETIPPTVALLGLLVTLARPEHRASLMGLQGAARRGPRRQLTEHFPGFLSDWGLLKGQVDPALAILAAAREQLRSANSSSGRGTGRAASRQGLPLPGIREAWLLLAILQDALGIDAAFLRQGLDRLHDLPDLPILDHPRPARRKTPHLHR